MIYGRIISGSIFEWSLKNSRSIESLPKEKFTSTIFPELVLLTVFTIAVSSLHHDFFIITKPRIAPNKSPEIKSL